METNNFSPAHSEVFKSSDNEILSEKSLIISPEGKSYLLTTAKWSGFIAIVGFAMIAIMVFGSLVAFFISPLLGEFQDFQMFQYMPMPFYFFGFFYLLMALICFFPYYYLYLFSKKIKSKWFLFGIDKVYRFFDIIKRKNRQYRSENFFLHYWIVRF